MARIGFAITDPRGGGAWYRGLLPARLLRSRGHEVVCGDVLRFGAHWELGIDLRPEEGGTVENPQGCAGELYTDAAGVEGEVWCPDVLVVTAGWSMGIVELLEVGMLNGAGAAGRNLEQSLVVDFDDGLDAPRDNAGWRGRQVEFKHGAASLSDRITCATPMIARDLALVKPRATSVVRNRIDPTLFDAVRAQNEPRLELERFAEEFMGAESDELALERDDRLAVGYRGPMPWHERDIEVLAEFAGRLVELGCYFVHVGAREDDARGFAEVLGIEYAERRAQVPWSSYPGQLAGIDLGLVPFARRRWSAYKSAIGALEWNAAGVPWLSSDVPEYRRLHAASAVSSRFGWERQIDRLRAARVRRELYERQRERSSVFYTTPALEALERHEAAEEWEVALGVEPALELSGPELLEEHRGR